MKNNQNLNRLTNEEAHTSKCSTLAATPKQNIYLNSFSNPITKIIMCVVVCLVVLGGCSKDDADDTSLWVTYNESNSGLVSNCITDIAIDKNGDK